MINIERLLENDFLQACEFLSAINSKPETHIGYCPTSFDEL